MTGGAAGAASGLRTGKSGVVFAAGGDPVTVGAGGLFGGSAPEGWRKEDAAGAVGPAAMEPGAGRAILLIGLVTAVDQAGGTLEIGAGVAPGGRIAAGFMGNVVAAETFGRGGGVEVTTGFRGLGGRLMRRVSRFGGFDSELSESVEFPSSAMVVVFIGIPVNVQWRNW